MSDVCVTLSPVDLYRRKEGAVAMGRDAAFWSRRIHAQGVVCRISSYALDIARRYLGTNCNVLIGLRFLDVRFLDVFTVYSRVFFDALPSCVDTEPSHELLLDHELPTVKSAIFDSCAQF